MEFWNYILLCSSFGSIIELGDSEKMIVCEGTNLEISCSGGNIIYVCEANYGRLKPGSYDNCDPATVDRDSNQNCKHPTSLQIVRNKCQGRPGCSFAVNNALFSPDPCGGVYKYLEVNVTCTRSVTPVSCDSITTTEEMLATTQQQTTEGTTTLEEATRDETTLKQTTTTDGITTITTIELSTEDITTKTTLQQTSKDSTTTSTTIDQVTTETNEETTIISKHTTNDEEITTNIEPRLTTKDTKAGTTEQQPHCQCTCVIQNITLEEKLDKIKKELSVNKSSLSSTRRKLISAKDNRTSAMQLGLIGATFLAVFLFMCISGDVLSVLIFLYKNVFVKVFHIEFDQMKSK